MEAFGIFEGGGAKGLAHIGALKAAEEHGVQFSGVAGTSAGSIVAALVAAGYVADELYSPDDATSLFQKNFLEFFPDKDWKNLQALTKAAAKTFAGNKGAIRLWCAANWFLIWHGTRLSRLRKEGGLLDTAEFETWLNDALVSKLKMADPTFDPSGEDGFVTFQDLPRPLKVISADVVNRRLRVFTMPGDARYNVAHAVGASISIPFIFLPKGEANARFVDGGIVSNFPAWVFDDEREKAPALTPTLGFRLVETNKRRDAVSASPESSFSVFSHISDVFQTAVFGDNTLERREVATLHEIPLRVRIGPLDFQVEQQTKDDVYRDGKSDARDYLQKGHIWRKPDSYMQQLLGIAEGTLRDALSHTGHLRLNIMLPISNDTLQVVYTRNMDDDDDCDDHLQFQRGSGACGLCWEKLDYIVCDLVDAAETYKDTWQMDKYQQRLVRKELQSLLCIPLFDQKQVRDSDGDSALLKKAFVGVLNVDSDEDLLESFAQLVEPDDNRAKDCAAMISKLLTQPSV